MAVPQYNKATRNNMRMAYKRVFGVAEKELNKKSHTSIMENAIIDIRNYAGLFDGESQELAEKRHAIDSVEKGNATDIVAYFKKLYPEDFKKSSNWDVVYIMYSRMDLSSPAEPVRSNVEDTAEPVTDDSNKLTQTNNSSSREKENKKMAVSLDEARKQAQGATVTQGSNVKPNDNISQAARDAVRDEKTSLQAKSQGTTATKICLSTRPLVQRCVAEDKAVGVIPEKCWDKTYGTFKEKLGYVESTDTFTKLADGFEEAARNMLQMLKAAKEDPNYTIAINKSKSTGTVKAIKLQKTDNTEQFYTKDQVRDFLLHETLGYIATTVPNTDVHIAKGRKVSGKKPSDKAVNIGDLNNLNDIVILKFCNRNDFQANGANVVYWKENLTEHKLTPGVKSELAVKFHPKNAPEKTQTYRLPLWCDMYETVATDEELIALLGKGNKTIGQQVAFDFNSEDAIKGAMEQLAEIRALVASSAVGNDVQSEDIRAKATAAEKATDKEAEEAFN